MKTIYKYKLKQVDTQTVKMPNDAQILSVGEQDGELMLWARVDTANEKEARKIEIYGDGARALDEHELSFIGTVQMSAGLVWHIFENR